MSEYHKKVMIEFLFFLVSVFARLIFDEGLMGVLGVELKLIRLKKLIGMGGIKL